MPSHRLNEFMIKFDPGSRFKILVVFGVILLALSMHQPGATAQSVAKKQTLKPLVKERFDFPLYREQFDSITSVWPIISNRENLVLVQAGEYLLLRKNKSTPFAAIGDFPQSFADFHLTTSFQVTGGTSAEPAGAGLLFMSQAAGKGGFVFEINSNQQFRLRQITAGGYRYLSGLQKDDGWLKSSVITPGQFNQVEIKTHSGRYDILVNGFLVFTYEEPAYTQGGIGFYVGPGSLCRVHFIDVFSDSQGGRVVPDLIQQDTVGSSDSSTTGNTDMVVLTESIIDLQSQINRLKSENESLREQVELLKGGEQESKSSVAQFQKRITTLEKQLAASKKTSDSLNFINQDLSKYKEMVNQNGDGGDLIITLSKNLKSEKIRNEELLNENRILRDSVGVLNKKIKLQAPAKSSVKKKP